MIVLLLFAFVSGFITILAPCIWPLLPIILSSTVTGEKRKPLGITLGIMISFALFTLTLSYFVKLFNFDPEILRLFAVYVIGLGIPLFIFATLGSHLFTKTRFLSKYTGRIQQIFGIIMILTAISIYTNYDKVIQVKLLDLIPSYSNFLYKL